MAVGARDYIDKLLVKKYANEKVDNHEAMESMVDPDKMLEAMNDVAMIQRNMFALSQRLCSTCYAINARRARYKDRLADLDDDFDDEYGAGAVGQ